MQGELRTPDHEAVLRHMRLLGERDLGAIRRMSLPTSHQATIASGLVTIDDHGPPVAETLHRKAVKHLDGGNREEAASYTFGLVSGSRLASDEGRPPR